MTLKFTHSSKIKHKNEEVTNKYTNKVSTFRRFSILLFITKKEYLAQVKEKKISKSFISIYFSYNGKEPHCVSPIHTLVRIFSI